jgi:hypothetical protein
MRTIWGAARCIIGAEFTYQLGRTGPCRPEPVNAPTACTAGTDCTACTRRNHSPASSELLSFRLDDQRFSRVASMRQLGPWCRE